MLLPLIGAGTATSRARMHQYMYVCRYSYAGTASSRARVHLCMYVCRHSHAVTPMQVQQAAVLECTYACTSINDMDYYTVLWLVILMFIAGYTVAFIGSKTTSNSVKSAQMCYSSWSIA